MSSCYTEFTEVRVLREMAISLGQDVSGMDTYTTLLRAILRGIGGTPELTDTQPILWRKILEVNGGTSSPLDHEYYTIYKLAGILGVTRDKMFTKAKLLQNIQASGAITGGGGGPSEPGGPSGPPTVDTTGYETEIATYVAAVEGVGGSMTQANADALNAFMATLTALPAEKAKIAHIWFPITDDEVGFDIGIPLTAGDTTLTGVNATDISYTLAGGIAINGDNCGYVPGVAEPDFGRGNFGGGYYRLAASYVAGSNLFDLSCFGGSGTNFYYLAGRTASINFGVTKAGWSTTPSLWPRNGTLVCLSNDGNVDDAKYSFSTGASSRFTTFNGQNNESPNCKFGYGGEYDGAAGTFANSHNGARYAGFFAGAGRLFESGTFAVDVSAAWDTLVTAIGRS